MLPRVSAFICLIVVIAAAKPDHEGEEALQNEISSAVKRLHSLQDQDGIPKQLVDILNLISSDRQPLERRERSAQQPSSIGPMQSFQGLNRRNILNRQPMSQQELLTHQDLLTRQQNGESWTTMVDNIISQGVLQFALGLSHAVETGEVDHRSTPQNVVFSPVNVAAALALVLAGSGGDTFKEIANVLGVSTGVNLTEKNRDKIHKEFGRFLSQLDASGNSVPVTGGQPQPVANGSNTNQLVFGNGLFIQKEYSVLDRFSKIAETYNAEILGLDFKRESHLARTAINKWFFDRTHGRIKNVLVEDPPESTRILIASALYFNGEWEVPFPVDTTLTRAFFANTPDGNVEQIPVRMMSNNHDLPYAADSELGCRLLELPYKGREVSMFLILPDKPGIAALRELESRLTAEKFEALIASRQDAPVIYSLPRMKLERSISLRAALQSLGIRTLFNANLANLTQITDGTPAGYHSAPVGTMPPPTTQQQQVVNPAAVPEQESLGSRLPDPSKSPVNATSTSSGPATPKTTTRPARPPQSRPPVFHPSASSQGTSTPPTAAPPSSSMAPAPTTYKPIPLPTRLNTVPSEDKNKDSIIFSSRSSMQDNGVNNVYLSPPDQAELRSNTPLLDNIYADDVLHKVEVEVTETGTVAAAATAVTLSRIGSSKVLRFNRPFIFMIRHRDTRLPLFWGTVIRPSDSWIVKGAQLPAFRAPTASGRVPPPVQPPPRPATIPSDARPPMGQDHAPNMQYPQQSMQYPAQTAQPATTSTRNNSVRSYRRG